MNLNLPDAQCEQLTGGDCGQHGPLFIPLGTHNMYAAVPDWKDAEIARLRARLDKAEAVVRAVEKLVEVLTAYRERA